MLGVSVGWINRLNYLYLLRATVPMLFSGYLRDMEINNHTLQMLLSTVTLLTDLIV